MNQLDEILLSRFKASEAAADGLEVKGESPEEVQQVNENFRLWITCEPHEDFPINLLQMSIKVTNEPPRGMKAGLTRSFNTVVDEDRLQRIAEGKDGEQWRDMVYGVCFLHSVVQERRKFGPVGWCIPYEFNQSDLEASLTFLEKHFYATTQSGLSWENIKYMICEVQYGGRITDDFDRILFNTFGKRFFNNQLFEPGFEFSSADHSDFKYVVPKSNTIDGYRDFISSFPNHDSPELFGLHQNAQLTFGSSEASYILDTISETQPKQSGATAGGRTREEIVFDKADELLKAMANLGYNMDIVRAKIKKRPKAEMQYVLGDPNAAKVNGFTVPLNVFLFQEIQRLQAVIKNVRSTLQDLKLAINGEIIMTRELQDALNSVYDAKPPKHWYMDAGGAEIAWSLPSLSLWFASLIDREKQLTSWLEKTRPNAFWLTGFFNPQGFLTAMRQEITRKHKEEKWALDDVVLWSEVTDIPESKAAKLKNPPDEGVYVYGMYLEGCAWDEKQKILCESNPKDLYTSMPLLHITAVTSKQASRRTEGRQMYQCPVYTKPRRTDLAYVFNVNLPTAVNPERWVMRGVALLCSKD